MADPITSLDLIARQASEAAASWKPGTPKPANPYDALTMPEHHEEWRRRFDLALLRLSAADVLEGAQ